MAVAAGLLLGLLLQRSVARGRLRPLAAVSALGVYLYLQFYLLVWNFGVFDGRLIDFRSYASQGVLEIAILMALLGVAFIRPRIAADLFGRFLVVLVVASAGFCGWQIMTNGSLDRSPQKVETTSTGVASSSFFRDDVDIMRNATSVSSTRKNVIVILLDTLQADVFEQVMRRDPDLRRQFTGFTLFNNATGHFPYTAMSVPAILTGEPYKADAESIPAYKERVAKKRIEAVLAKQGAEPSRIPLESRQNYLGAESAECRSYANVYDLFGFRQLPIALKPFFYDDGRFRVARLCGAIPPTNPEVDLAVFDK
ncbi:hypothetical protein HI113_43165, partial [Corallococcus exiguus]|uniref:hypothetical protein n=1 Tax=Corallococcus exiguus TaxID=83462 RepID=UPI0014740259